MAIFKLDNVGIYLGSAELSCVSNSVALETSADSIDVTTFCDAEWKNTIGGQKSWTLNASGFTDYEFETATPNFDVSPDEAAFQAVALGGSTALLVTPDGADAAVYFGQASATTYSNGGAVGEASAFSLDAEGADGAGLVRGSLLAPRDTYEGAGIVPPHDHGSAISASAKVYVTLHQLNASLSPGDTIKVYSSATVGFSSPVERFAFDAEDLASHSVSMVSGVTHRYWRIEYDLAAPVAFVAAIAVV